MLIRARKTVLTSQGTLTLQGWDSYVADARLLDLLAVQAVLEQAREEWPTMRRTDVEQPVWDAFWRLVHASLVPGERIPGGLNFRDRVAILSALWDLNDIEATEGELRALRERMIRRMTRISRRAQN